MAEKGFLGSAYEARTAEEVREFYDRWSKVYDEELTENQYMQPERCASALVSRIPDMASVRILDVGCGTGLSGIALAGKGAIHLDGCDFSEGMLTKAFSTGVYSKLFKADLNNPPLDAHDHEYDALAAVGVFSFGHIQPDALDDLLRVTKPGGPMVIGLNDHFWQEGSLKAKLDALQGDGLVEIHEVEAGEHIPGIGLTGWVITLKRL